MPLRGLYPALLVLVDKAFGEQQRLPRRYSKPASLVKLTSDTFVKCQVDALRIVRKLDDIKQPVTCLSKNGLRSSAQLSNKPRYESEVLTMYFQNSPQESRSNENHFNLTRIFGGIANSSVSQMNEKQ
jgi:hypothetical protein